MQRQQIFPPLLGWFTNGLNFVIVSCRPVIELFYPPINISETIQNLSGDILIESNDSCTFVSVINDFFAKWDLWAFHPIFAFRFFVGFGWQMCNSCHIRRLTKRWNSRRTWNICYVFNFQLKKIRSKIIQITLIELWSFISFELRHLNSMKMSQKAKFGCSIFQLKIKRKQIFQVRHQFGHFVKCRIWHESRIKEHIYL